MTCETIKNKEINNITNYGGNSWYSACLTKNEETHMPTQKPQLKIQNIKEQHNI